ncbi:LOW QUALITY PROTEIN: cytochrome P450 2C20-like [Ictalurus furcatus]|uniref:LOW QUALITY PROTEIN: cytochrome P450 2C20-like n=1 Tax=Ictalurus furcatus TaxID=66913 RepID=UPI00234FCDA0|nr:LOW QUALITY PROTEIN: cytochrome P450 2C20-like [Ictalurus furcatus]
MNISSTLLLLGLVIALLILLRWRNQPHNLPPGPTALPLLGNILTMDNRAPFKTFLKWSKTYGPVMTVYLGTQRVLILVGYDTVKEALVDNADDFIGRAPVPFIQKVLKGYEMMRKEVIEIHQSGKGYKATSKALKLQRTTVRAIISKSRKLSTVVNLPRSGQPSKIPPSTATTHPASHKRAKDNIKGTTGSLASIKVTVHDSTIRKTLGKNGIHGRVKILKENVQSSVRITISNGERWRQLRRFTLTTLRDFGMGRKRMEGWIQEESRHLLDNIKETNSAPVDPTFYLSRAVSNIVCALVFGQRFSYEDSHFLRLLQVFTGVLQFGSSTWGQLYNIFPWLVELLPGNHLKLINDVDELKDFSRGKVQEHKDNLDPENPRDFIDCFLIRLKQEKDNPNTEFHYENLIATVLNLFLAGTETTSTTIRYALMLLIKHPEIQTRMQKEIDTVIGQERSPSLEDRKSLPFTDAVIHEVQRYIDLVPLNVPHYTTHQITFRGYTIPKDTVILPLLHSVLRDEEHWEKPWSFDPRHFLDTNGNFKKNPAFLPFSAGKRSCVGESLARMELFIFLVSLLQHFTFTTPGGPESVDSTPEISGFANLPRKYQLIATPR